MTKNKQINPPADLLAKIMLALKSEKQKRLLKQRLFLVGAWFLVSIIIVIPEAGRLLGDLQTSGFADFFSLLFSDFAIVRQSSGSFLMSLLQTLPALNLALTLSILLMILKSGQLLNRYFKRALSLA